MQRFSFPLQSGEDRVQFKQSVDLLASAQAGGWTLVAVNEGFLGGLPAGQFVITSGDVRETIPFRLSAKTLAGFKAAAAHAAELPAGQWVLSSAEIEGTAEQTEGVLTLTPAESVRGAVAKRRAAPTLRAFRDPRPVQPSAYDLTETAALRGLREGTGHEADQLRALLGDDYFEMLGELARRGPTKRGGGLGKALVLPGIMGSKLGTTKSLFGLVDYSDVIWLDPVDMRRGRLAELALGQGSRPQHGTQSVGVLYSFYLRLKLNLDVAGFDADFHHYDWRRPVRDLGAEFARFLNQQKEPVTIVAHSMGGIVTRAALKAGAKNVKRLIMIGTPNHGSFVPAQAMRGAYPFLKTLAITFDRDLPTITEEVFSSFAGLYDMLAAKEKFPNFPLFDPKQWPDSRPRARADLIRNAANAQSQLAPADERFHLICGIDEDTVVDLRKEDNEFVFLQNKDGDGTVPRISAELPNCPTLFVRGSHGMLPNLGIVCDLAVDLARDGKTGRETVDWKPPTEPLREVRESALRSAVEEVRGLRRGEEPSPAVLREIMTPILALPPLEAGKSDSVSAPPPKPPGGAEALFQNALKGVVVGRRQQRQLEVALFPGSLTAVSSRAYLLGLFQGVAPTGAASAVDNLMNGVISDLVERRMLSGRLGEIFIVPKGRTFVPAEHVIFVGLGPFDRYKQRQSTDDGEPDAMRLICESAVRTCLHANIEEFATVLLGASAADDTAQAVRLFTNSFLQALRTADPQRRLRKITLCETDPRRVAEIRTELLQLATTDLFADVELELRDLEPPPGPVVALVSPASPRRPAPLYLLTRMYDLVEQKPSGSRTKPVAPTQVLLETSLLTPQSKAAVLTTRRTLPISARTSLLAPISADGFNPAKLEKLGRELAEFVFDEPMRQALQRLADTVRDLPLVVVHDPVASQLPWEAFRFGDWTPALSGGLVRQHLDSNFSVAKWLEQRADDKFLDVLLVTNPTGDLFGAERESEGIRALLNKVPNVRVTERRHNQATRQQLLTDFRSGQFDVVHYAGHAFFAPQHPGRSGLICAGREILAGGDLAGLSQLPSLIFFNACESGLIRGRAGPSAKTRRQPTDDRMPVENLSVASAFIRGGVANFLGTYWPVGDLAAKKFSETFYPLLVEGRTIGEAVLAARRAVQQAGSADWADYMLYGNPGFVLKRRES